MPPKKGADPKILKKIGEKHREAAKNFLKSTLRFSKEVNKSDRGIVEEERMMREKVSRAIERNRKMSSKIRNVIETPKKQPKKRQPKKTTEKPKEQPKRQTKKNTEQPKEKQKSLTKKDVKALMRPPETFKHPPIRLPPGFQKQFNANPTPMMPLLGVNNSQPPLPPPIDAPILSTNVPLFSDIPELPADLKRKLGPQQGPPPLFNKEARQIWYKNEIHRLNKTSLYYNGIEHETQRRARKLFGDDLSKIEDDDDKLMQEQKINEQVLEENWLSEDKLAFKWAQDWNDAQALSAQKAVAEGRRQRAKQSAEAPAPPPVPKEPVPARVPKKPDEAQKSKLRNKTLKQIEQKALQEISDTDTEEERNFWDNGQKFYESQIKDINQRVNEVAKRYNLKHDDRFDLLKTLISENGKFVQPTFTQEELDKINAEEIRVNKYRQLQTPFKHEMEEAKQFLKHLLNPTELNSSFELKPKHIAAIRRMLIHRNLTRQTEPAHVPAPPPAPIEPAQVPKQTESAQVLTTMNPPNKDKEPPVSNVKSQVAAQPYRDPYRYGTGDEVYRDREASPAPPPKQPYRDPYNYGTGDEVYRDREASPAPPPKPPEPVHVPAPPSVRTEPVPAPPPAPREPVQTQVLTKPYKDPYSESFSKK